MPTINTDFEREKIEDCGLKLLSYYYRNTSTTTSPPIIYSSWEVSNSSGTLLATSDDAFKSDFTYAFPYLDTFTIKLTVRDSALNEDSEIKTYVVDECPICAEGGGGPSAPAMAEKYETVREVRVTKINMEDLEYSPIIKAEKIKEDDFDDSEFSVKVDLIKKETL